VIPEIETQIGANLARIVADRGYRGHNAPPDHKFKVYISGQRRRVTETTKRELRRRSAVELVIGHAKSEHRMDRNYLAGATGPHRPFGRGRRGEQGHQPARRGSPQHGGQMAPPVRRACLDGLLDEPRPGAPRRIGDDEVAETIRLTLDTPRRDATHWSPRSMARAVEFAPSTIHRIWKAFNLQPHRTKTFKLSADPPICRQGARYRRALSGPA
jgi:hypothetical protein